MTTSTASPISVVVVGITRRTAITTATVLAGTRYHLAAVLDFTESPAPFQFSPQNLGAVLYATYPRARALVTGTAVSEADRERIRPVWEAYTKTVPADDEAERLPTGWVALSDWHARPGPPPPGWEVELRKRLDEVFDPSTAV